MREIILEAKEKVYYMKTAKLRKKVHKEYPEYRIEKAKVHDQSFLRIKDSIFNYLDGYLNK